MGAVVITLGAAIFAIGIVAGVFLVASIGIQREERDFRRTGRISMTRLAPDRVSHGTRGLVGLSALNCTDVSSAATRHQEMPATLYQDTLV